MLRTSISKKMNGIFFKGFLSFASNINQNALMDGHVFRNINNPFEECGILASDMLSSAEYRDNYIKALGLIEFVWIFIDCNTWADKED